SCGRRSSRRCCCRRARRSMSQTSSTATLRSPAPRRCLRRRRSRCRSATPRPPSSRRSSASFCSRRCAATAATSAKLPRRSACIARTCNRSCASSASRRRRSAASATTPIDALHHHDTKTPRQDVRGFSVRLRVLGSWWCLKGGTMHFVYRFTNLLRGTFAQWVRRRERRNPAAVYEAAISERVTQYDTLRAAAAGVIYLRGKLARQLEGASQQLAGLEVRLEMAVEHDDDDTALGLIRRRDGLRAEVERLTAELSDLTSEAEGA